MMDDLVLECCKHPGGAVEVEEADNGATVVRIFGNVDAASVVLSREASATLRDWLKDRLRPTEPLQMPQLPEIPMTCKPESKKQRLERIAVQLMAGYLASPLLQPKLGMELFAKESIAAAQHLIKQLDALPLDE